MDIATEQLVLQRPRQIAARLVAREGDEAESVVYMANLSVVVKEELLSAIKRRRFVLEGIRGY